MRDGWKKGAGVDDEIVDGGLRIPKGQPGVEAGRREHEQNEAENRGCGSRGGRRSGGVAASGDYGWP